MISTAHLTPEEAARAIRDELLRRDEMRRKASTVSSLPAFASLLDIKTKSKGVVRFTRERWNAEQRKFYAARTGRDLILKARQVGFTTFGLAEDMHHVRTRRGAQALIVTQDSDAAEALFQAVHLMAESLVAEGYAPKPQYSTRREIMFGDTRSVIRVVEAGATEKAASKKGRSGTITRLHATEVAFWGAATETMTALANAVPKDGEILMESTANGAAGLFYEACQSGMKGLGDLKFHFFPWFEHDEYRENLEPGFDPAPRDKDEEQLRELGCDDGQIAYWRAALADPLKGGREKLKQEMPSDPLSCFRSPGGAYIPADACDALAALSREPLCTERIVVRGRHLGDLIIYEQPMGDTTYIVAADVAEGTGGDASTIDVSEWRTGRTVATFASDSIEYGDHGLACAWAGTKYNRAVVAPERNNHGSAVLTALSSIESEVTPYDNVYVAADGKLGWLTSGQTRPVMFDESRTAIVEGVWITPDARTIAECRTLARDHTGKPAARGKGTKSGAMDDAWIAKAIGWQVRKTAAQELVAPQRQNEPEHVLAGMRRTGAWR